MFAAEKKRKGYNKNHHLKNPRREHVGMYYFFFLPSDTEDSSVTRQAGFPLLGAYMSVGKRIQDLCTID